MLIPVRLASLLLVVALVSAVDASTSAPTARHAAPTRAGGTAVHHGGTYAVPAAEVPALYRRTPAGEVATRDLARLCHEYWEDQLRNDPLEATAIGDRRFDEQLPDNSPQGLGAEERRLQATLQHARGIVPEVLSPQDRITRSALIESAGDHIAVLQCHLERWNVDPLGGPQVALMNLPDITVIRTPHEAHRFVVRCRAMGSYLDQQVANLKLGLAGHQTACVAGVRKVLQQLEALDRQKLDDGPLMAPTLVRRDAWTLRDRDRFHDDMEVTLRTIVMPAFARYRQFLEHDVLPVARSEEHPGLVALPSGLACYKRLIRVHTSLDRTPEELHQLGLDEVKRVRGELGALGKRVLGTGDIEEIQRRLRTDPAMHFRTAAEVEAEARRTLERARAALPRWFGTLPKAACEVKVMGMYEAPQSTIAYYREPAADGSRPGNYMINTYQPTTRPRYEAEVLAFHESIPGHHLQIAIAQELKNLPEFRRHEGVTAFVEGWGLYSERLASDMGLYSADLDRIGMLSFDAWRACRLVVDTGIHAMGWSRGKAIDYMKANTVLAENNIENEVDRYIANPGQALAYKCGQLELLRLRDDAKRRLGDRFDIRAFHDAVLTNGAVALPILDQQIEEWIVAREDR